MAAALPPLVAQLDPDDELVVVDNDSADDTLSVVRELAPAATVIETGAQRRLRRRRERGRARRRSGDLLVFLNPDATPAPGFAEAIAAPLRDDRGWTAWMGLVTAEPGSVVNTNGGVVHFTGIAWAGEAGRPAPGTLAGPREVAFLSGACLAVPRAQWERAGGFAEAFFMYHEDVDLSLRLRLAGGRLGVEPAAVVDHDYEFAKGPDKWRLLERNRWATIVRCYPGRLLLVLAPALLATELALLVVAAAGGWLPQKLRGTAETLRGLPRLLRERRAIQATRAISAAEFARWLTPDLDSPFLGRAARLSPLRWALRAYWRAARRPPADGRRGKRAWPTRHVPLADVVVPEDDIAAVVDVYRSAGSAWARRRRISRRSCRGTSLRARARLLKHPPPSAQRGAGHARPMLRTQCQARAQLPAVDELRQPGRPRSRDGSRQAADEGVATRARPRCRASRDEPRSCGTTSSLVGCSRRMRPMSWLSDGIMTAFRRRIRRLVSRGPAPTNARRANFCAAVPRPAARPRLVPVTRLGQIALILILAFTFFVVRCGR